jgi:hypothetical protein
MTTSGSGILQRAHQRGNAAPPALAQRFQGGVSADGVIGRKELDELLGLDRLGGLLDRPLALGAVDVGERQQYRFVQRFRDTTHVPRGVHRTRHGIGRFVVPS